MPLKAPRKWASLSQTHFRSHFSCCYLMLYKRDQKHHTENVLKEEHGWCANLIGFFEIAAVSRMVYYAIFSTYYTIKVLVRPGILWDLTKKSWEWPCIYHVQSFMFSNCFFRTSVQWFQLLFYVYFGKHTQLTALANIVDRQTQPQEQAELVKLSERAGWDFLQVN